MSGSLDLGARYRELLEYLPVGVYRTAPDGRILEANRALALMLGFRSVSQLRLLNAGDFYVKPSDRSQHLERTTRGGLEPIEHELVRADGGRFWVRDYCRAALGPHGEALHYDGILVDITTERSAREALRASEADYRGLFENAHDAILVVDRANGTILDANQKACDIYGYVRDEIVGTPNAGRFGLPGNYETVQQRPDGTQITLDVRTTEVEHRGRSALLSIQRDITERKRMEETIRALALHDALTGLPNRKLLYDRLDVAIQHARRRQGMLALLFLDLDGFKEVNDRLGHAAGDELLTALAGRLVSALRSSDTVARIGGDEFTVLLSDVRAVEAASETARKILQELRKPLSVAGVEVTVTASLGIALYPVDGSSPDELLGVADGAMYRAKGAGKDRSARPRGAD